MILARGICLGWLASTLAWGGIPTRAADFTWSAGPDVAVPMLDSQDADAGLIQDGPDLWLQTSFYPDWHRFRGTNLDNLTPVAEAPRDLSFTKPNGDDAYWSNGIWQDENGKRHAIIHIESNYAIPRQAFLWKRRIGLATSTDQGANWHYEGDILTTNPARPGAPTPKNAFQDFGCGDTYLFVDRRHGFFYLYYMTAWVYTRSGWRTGQAMHVARSSFRDKMAPGSWRKWDNGQWTSSGFGGNETPIFTNTDSSVIHFNIYLNSYVAFGHDSDNRSWITTCSDLALQNWKLRDRTFPQRLLWYNWPVDAVTNDRYEIGQSFRLYSSQVNVEGVGSKYFELTFSRNGNLSPKVSLFQPVNASAGEPLCLIATASDADGKVSTVEFFADKVKIGEVAKAPYLFIWKNPPAGQHRLSIRATDNSGAVAESPGVNFPEQSLQPESQPTSILSE